MSRWHIVRIDPALRTITIGHACPGCHSPYKETQTFDWFERQWRDADLPRTDLGPKPTHACWLCRYEPHLPGPRDFAADLEPGRLDAWLDEILDDYKRTPVGR